MHGRLLTWFPQRNYGFIKLADSNEEYFVHATDFDGPPLPRGTWVSFELGKFGGKIKAINVKAAEPEVVSGVEQ